MIQSSTHIIGQVLATYQSLIFSSLWPRFQESANSYKVKGSYLKMLVKIARGSTPTAVAGLAPAGGTEVVSAGTHWIPLTIPVGV